MTPQLDMFDGASPPARKPTITEAFEAFHTANPHVFEEMRRLALARVARGERRVGAKALWEELRESIRVRKLGNWKLNNSYTAMYARKLLDAEPALVGKIELRQRKAK